MTRLIVEPDPVRRVLQFLKVLSPDFPLSAPHNFDTAAPVIEQQPELAALIEAAIVKKGSVLMRDQGGSATVGYALRYHAWSNWAMLQILKPVADWVEAHPLDTVPTVG